MKFIYGYFSSFWEITLLMHAYIIFGLVAAGILKEFISDDYIKRNLGGKGLVASVKAALIGLPLPMCSCSVIPLALSLRKSGAGRGAVTSFFISTPMTGVDSIIATYGVFGWVITLMRVVSASVAAIVAGVFTDKFSDAEVVSEAESCECSGCCCGEPESEEKKTFLDRVVNIFRYAFVELLGDLAYPLLSGLFMAAAIMQFISPDMPLLREGVAIGYIIAFVAGIPLYVCSISAIPIALSLLGAGFSPGAAFVFLAGAPATNIIAVNVIKNILGKRGVVIYLLSIIGVTLAFALLVDYIYAGAGVDFTAFAKNDESGIMTNIYSASLFLVVITFMAVKQKINR